MDEYRLQGEVSKNRTILMPPGLTKAGKLADPGHDDAAILLWFWCRKVSSLSSSDLLPFGGRLLDFQRKANERVEAGRSIVQSELHVRQDPVCPSKMFPRRHYAQLVPSVQDLGDIMSLFFHSHQHHSSSHQNPMTCISPSSLSSVDDSSRKVIWTSMQCVRPSSRPFISSTHSLRPD